MELTEKWISDFPTLCAEVEHEGQKVRPDTLTSIAIGKVHEIEDKGNDNLRVVVRVKGAKFAFAGFTNDNSPAASILRQAHEKDLTVCVRFEKKRKKSVSPLLKMEELTKDATTARDSIVNIVAGVYSPATKEWILTQDAVSNPAEDPDYVMLEIEKAAYSTKDFFGSSNNEPSVSKSAGNNRANHLVTMYTFASDLNVDNELGLGLNEVKTLASLLLKAADTLQMSVYGLDAPNYSDYSHTKARGLLFSWIRSNPLTAEIMRGGQFNSWIKKFLDESRAVWTWAIQDSMPTDVSNQ